MFFWNIKKLKEELIHNGLSQKALFFYVIVFILLSQIVSEIGVIFPNDQDATTADYLQVIVDLAIVGIGTYLCFYANGGSSGKLFAERYFSISFVVGVRFLVLMIPVSALVVISWELLEPLTGLPAEGPEMAYATMAVTSTWAALMFWRTIKHINDVAKTAHAGNAGAP